MSDMTLDQALVAQAERPDEDGPQAEELVKLVIFTLGADAFAFYGASVGEILARADVFFLPGCPPSLEGVINVRGDIESVLRPHRLLGLADDGAGPGAPILLGRGAGMKSGIRVDEVLDVADVPRAAIEPPAATLPPAVLQAATGALRFGERLVIVLDLDKLFAACVEELG
ncbi:MAG: chemotaxis protein CheW [Solidesulfovibrio sp. DCME]|uniref:chemotaxis protein CheW n=1 Tax=Solidesulfovibrio sp. DCME TaxID=3447380 RepID=UPI003D111037